MNYAEFYKSAKNVLTDSLVSLWFKGKAKEQEYVRHLLTEDEPLLAAPVFQSIFPWENSNESFEEHASKLKILSPSFVEALSSESVDEEMRFPKDRHPYKHQTKSWETMLSEKGKTIVVTSGTGSGKTECFMIPVLQDIANRNEQDCVQAIFLYPLNALMKSQQKRIHAWCSALSPKVTYAIYNGDTEKDDNGLNFTEPHYPQLVTRPQIRKTPPQILFTNPTMLNYMLVRAEDKTILEKSRGKLKWILLDEAHTYTGSSAAELSLQLRRVLDAFGVSMEQVNFAVTSATIGDEKDPNAELKLKKFVSQLTGKPIDSISVIGGKRVIPEMDEQRAQIAINDINSKLGTNITLECIKKLRQQLNAKPVLSATDIVKQIDKTISKDIVKSLELIDAMGNRVDGLNRENGKPAALLPSRAHYFIRSISGLYACVNHECKRHKKIRLDIGSLTTFQNTNCPECKSRMLEVATCPSCGGSIIVGETSTSEGFRMRTNILDLDNHLFYDNNEDLVASEEQNTEDATQNTEAAGFTPFYFAKPDKKCLRHHTDTYEYVFNHEKCKIEGVDKNDNINPKIIYKALGHSDNNASLCPHCGNKINRLNYMRASATILGRMLATLLLDHAEAGNIEDGDVLYDGKKYITFTDNRQGSARSAMGLNQDVERAWVRSAIFRELADIRLDGISPTGLTDNEEQKYLAYKKIQSSLPPVLQNELDTLEARRNGLSIIPDAPEVAWESIWRVLENHADLRKLFRHLRDARSEICFGNGSNIGDANTYLKALMVDQFGWIPKRANSLETLGLVRLCYPTIGNAKCPALLLRNGCNDADWQNFLKICLDYLVRGGRHYMISGEFATFLTQNNATSAIYPYNSNLRQNDHLVSKWPHLKQKVDGKVQEEQSRLVLLLCAVLGYNNIEDFNQEKIANINGLMGEAWDFITRNVLSATDPDNHGYMLDLLGPRVKLQLMDKGYLCPVDNVIVDVTFRGYSPRMNGYINKENFDRFKVTQEFTYPYFPFKANENNSEAINKWIEDNLSEQKKAGVFSTIHQSVYTKKPIFIAAEHSAQQKHEDLERYEQEFNAGHLNILSCSTTMEMGVDIGGISEVVMNNVPPKSANYLQRAGRAGRRNETKALALTFCAPNPIGTFTWNNPSYPITHVTETPLLKLESRQIVQRHVNALIFADFISRLGGMRVSAQIQHFFLKQNETTSLYDCFLDYIDQIIERQGQSSDTAYSHLVKGTALEGVSISDAVVVTKKDICSVFEVFSAHLESLNKSFALLNGNGKAACAIERQKKILLEKSLLTYLADNSFLPSAGIPTGLVECTLDGGFRDGGNYPTLHISQAVSAYAPGNQVVKNEWIYEPKGIRIKTKYDADTSRYILQNCTKCGYTTITYGNAMNHCPKCGGQDTMHGIRDIGIDQRFTEVVEPAAFTVAWGDKPTRKMNGQGGMNFVQPVLLEMEPWQEKTSSAKMIVRCSTPQSEILFYNRGKHNFGYAFCPFCGKMESERSVVTANNPLSGHRNLSTGKLCQEGRNVRRHVLLVGRYQTDFVEIKFYDGKNNLIKDEETLYSLGVILSRKLTELLGVNDGEIDFGYNGKNHSIFIYDTALGGAGYSTLFREYKDTVMDMAYNSLNNCDCERSCTKCLIDRRSQWYLNYLNRNKALEWLEVERKARNAPEAIKSLVPDAAVVTSDFATELYHLARNKNIELVNVFVDNDYESWQPSDFPYTKMMTEMGLTGVTVTFVLGKPIDLINCSTSIRTILLSALFQYKFSYLNGTLPGQLKPLLSVTYNDGKMRTFFGEDVINSLSSSWGEGEVFSTMSNYSLSYNPIDATQLLESITAKDSSVMFDVRIKEDCNLNAILKSLMNEKKEKWQHIKEEIANKAVIIEYTDRYVHTPLGCMLLANLVKEIKNVFNLNVQQFKIFVAKPSYNICGNSEVNICDDFQTSNMRNEFLFKAITHLVGVKPDIYDNSYLKHERCLTIKTASEELCIRPDAGIANGWRPFGRDNAAMNNKDFEYDWEFDLRLYNQNKNCSGILYTISFSKIDSFNCNQ